MSEIVIRANIGLKELLNIIRQLKPEEKNRVYRELENEWRNDFSSLLTEIREKFVNDPLSEEEIQEEVEAARSDLYEQHKGGFGH